MNKIIKQRELDWYPRYDPRKIKGALAYGEMRDVEMWVKKDLSDGKFIEAYAITEQYVDMTLKFCFPDVFFEKKNNEKLSVETVLRCSISLNQKIVDKKLLDFYRDFKSTRDDLMHNSLFNQKKAKQLTNKKKVNYLPLSTIDFVQEFFKKRAYNTYVFFLLKPELKNFIKGKKELNIIKNLEIPEYFQDFYLIWGSILEKEGKEISSELHKFHSKIKSLSDKKQNQSG